MACLIDDLLALSRVTRGGLDRTETNLSALAKDVVRRLKQGAPKRRVEFIIADGIVAHCDDRLLTIAFENLLGNAWKFTGKRDNARIEVGISGSNPQVYFVRDNGVGFEMSHASKLFGVFQRLHPKDEFEGTGVGLVTVQRIVRGHGGRIWAEAAVGSGATFFFTLEEQQPQDATPAAVSGTRSSAPPRTEAAA
ncbi:MAG: sensor histidine kinase [Pseudolabrys sp.]